MQKNTMIITRSTKTPKDINNAQSRKIAQDAIDKQKEEYARKGGKIEQVESGLIRPA